MIGSLRTRECGFVRFAMILVWAMGSASALASSVVDKDPMLPKLNASEKVIVEKTPNCATNFALWSGYVEGRMKIAEISLGLIRETSRRHAYVMTRSAGSASKGDWMKVDIQADLAESQLRIMIAQQQRCFEQMRASRRDLLEPAAPN